jgi:hypothetical protein
VPLLGITKAADATAPRNTGAGSAKITATNSQAWFSLRIKSCGWLAHAHIYFEIAPRVAPVLVFLTDRKTPEKRKKH